MIRKIEIDKRSMDNVIGDINSIIKILKSPEMQLHRAKKFRDYTINSVSSGRLGLKPIKETTKKISGDHPPEWNSGNIVSSMNVRKMDGNSAGAGYFGDEAGTIAGKSITQTEAAILQHTGYRIPLTGEKGERVRKWLFMQGVLDTGMQIERSFYKSHRKSSSEKWIEVKPRPFIFKSLNAYTAEDRDFKATNEFLDKELRKANV